ncbi:MAG: coproporphyrinogen III oxidase, partial [Fusobacterium sp.]|nr:coproporphyrinogen III oxidase [Fusobacterium sp.]
DSGEIQGIRLSTRPDCIDDEILTQLKKYGVQTIELGVQSLDPEVLKATDRATYGADLVGKSSALIKKYGFELGIQLMIGLPCSNLENDFETALKILEFKPDIARIYPTLVISGTELERMYLKNKYVALTVDEAVERTLKIYSLLEKNNVNIIRVGLQPSEDLTAEGVILAGPFHPAFRELVETKLYFNFLNNIYLKDKFLEIYANEKNISKIIGQKAINKKSFAPNFEIKIDSDLGLNQIKINDILYDRKDILEYELKR